MYQCKEEVQSSTSVLVIHGSLHALSQDCISQRLEGLRSLMYQGPALFFNAVCQVKMNNGSLIFIHLSPIKNRRLQQLAIRHGNDNFWQNSCLMRIHVQFPKFKCVLHISGYIGLIDQQKFLLLLEDLLCQNVQKKIQALHEQFSNFKKIILL